MKKLWWLGALLLFVGVALGANGDPMYEGLAVDELVLLESGVSPTYETSLVSGNLSADVEFTFPTGLPSATSNLTMTTGGVMSFNPVSMVTVAPSGDTTGANDVTALQIALNTGKAVQMTAGNYYLNDELVFSTVGQLFQGAGATATILNVVSSFDTAEDGILTFACGEPGPELRSFWIRFYQPETSDRAELVEYPPAIYARATPRFRVYDLRISKAIDGIDTTGNSGGFIVDGLEMSMFDKGIIIDGSLDVCRINDFHVWCFDIATDSLLRPLMRDSTGHYRNVGIYDVGSDNVQVSNFFSFCGLGVYLDDDTDPTIMHIENSHFEVSQGIRAVNAQLQVTNCTFYFGDAAHSRFAMITNGGATTVSNCKFILTPPVEIPLKHYDGVFQMSNCYVYHTENIKTFYHYGPGTAVLSGVVFARYGTTGVISEPRVYAAAGATLTMTGCHFMPRTTADSVVALTLASTTDYHTIVGNFFGNWTTSHIVSAGNTVFGSNNFN